MKNIDNRVVKEFGEEWKTFEQDKIFGKEQNKIFNDYFNGTCDLFRCLCCKKGRGKTTR